VKYLLWFCLIGAAFGQMFPSPGPGWISSGGGGTTAYVKGCTGSNSGVSSIACTPSGNVSVGVIACYGEWDTSRTFSSLAKSSGTATVGSFTGWDTGGAFTVKTSGTNAATMGFAAVTGTGTATITLTVTGGTASVNLMCHNISGTAASPYDAGTLVVQASPGSGTNAVTTGNVTTTVNGDYLFVGTWDVGGNSSSIAAGTGYTLRDQISVGGRTTESQVQTSAGAVAGTFTPTGGTADTWLNGIMAFHP
jgi:hypothetical protein